MSKMSKDEAAEFFAAANAAAKKSIWAAVATVANGTPRVRMVHPTWEGEILWFATGASTPKALQIRQLSDVDLQFQVAPPDFIHLLVRGTATVHDDQATKDHAWGVLDYDLAQFWPEGPTSAEFVAVKVSPSRVELSEMFGTANRRVWTP